MIQSELELGALDSWHGAPSPVHVPGANRSGGVPLLWAQL